MFQFIETMKLFDGNIINIQYHQQRLQKTLERFFGYVGIDLTDIPIPKEYQSGIYKFRVVYDKQLGQISFEKYNKKLINYLICVTANNLIYDYKYLDRSNIYEICKMLPEDAEPIFVKNGFVTDSSYTNLVFESDDGFFTPDSPLLEGTKRAALLDSGLIKSIAININSLSRYNKVHLINSMNDLGESTYDIDKVILKK